LCDEPHAPAIRLANKIWSCPGDRDDAPRDRREDPAHCFGADAEDEPHLARSAGRDQPIVDDAGHDGQRDGVNRHDAREKPEVPADS
jgi:hypothetical protein